MTFDELEKLAQRALENPEARLSYAYRAIEGDFRAVVSVPMQKAPIRLSLRYDAEGKPYLVKM